MILALGIPPMFASLEQGQHIDNGVMVLGYVVMRIAIFLNVSTLQFFLLAVLLAVVELAGPAVAERREPTPWHAHHMAQRYSLLTIIAQVLRLGYGHLVIFASVASTGVGLHVVAGYLEEAAAGQGQAGEQPAHHIGATGVVLAVVIPVAVYTVALYVIYTWLVGEFDRFHSWLLRGTVVFLVLPVLLAIGGVAIPVCLLVLMLAPVVMIVGYETVGHAHQADVISRVMHPGTSSGLAG